VPQYGKRAFDHHADSFNKIPRVTRKSLGNLVENGEDERVRKGRHLEEVCKMIRGKSVEDVDENISEKWVFKPGFMSDRKEPVRTELPEIYVAPSVVEEGPDVMEEDGKIGENHRMSKFIQSERKKEKKQKSIKRKNKAHTRAKQRQKLKSRVQIKELNEHQFIDSLENQENRKKRTSQR